jgi:hypothetical protein
MKEATNISVIGNEKRPEEGCWIELTAGDPSKEKLVGTIHLDQDRIHWLTMALKKFIPDY